MKIKVEAEVPSGRHCEICDYFNEAAGGYPATCSLFLLILNNKKPCSDCLKAREESKQGKGEGVVGGKK